MGGNEHGEGRVLLLPGVTSGSPDVSGGSERESVTHRQLARASTAGNFYFDLLTLSFKGSVMFYAKDTRAMIKNSHLPWKQPIANFKNHSYFSVLPLFRVQLCKQVLGRQCSWGLDTSDRQERAQGAPPAGLRVCSALPCDNVLGTRCVPNV